MTRGKRLLMDMNSMALFGKPLDNYIKDTVADEVAARIAAATAAAVTAAVAATAAATAAAATAAAVTAAAEKKAERQHVIRSLKNARYSSEQIAQLLGFDLEEVRKVQIES